MTIIWIDGSIGLMNQFIVNLISLKISYFRNFAKNNNLPCGRNPFSNEWVEIQSSCHLDPDGLYSRQFKVYLSIGLVNSFIGLTNPFAKMVKSLSIKIKSNRWFNLSPTACHATQTPLTLIISSTRQITYLKEVKNV